MKTVILYSLTFLIASSSVHGQASIEKEIISDLISEEFGPIAEESGMHANDQKQRCIIIISETVTQSLDTKEKFLRNSLDSLDLYTMNDFFKRNLNSVKVTEFSLAQMKIIFLPHREYEKIMDQGGWNQYHKIYGYIPKITLSRPGINKNMDKAFIYYDVISDKLGGAGFYLILKKVNERWIVKEKIIAWRS